MFRRLPYGFVEGVFPIGLDSNDPITQARGIAKRMGRILPPLDTTALTSFGLFVDSFLRKHLVPLNSIMGFEEWLDSTSYNETRKDQLRRAWEQCHYTSDAVKFRKIASFMKTEPYPEFKHCRGINSRHDAFKAYSGPVFKSIERVVYDLVDCRGNRLFAKHVPVSDRPSYIMGMFEAGDQVMATDYSAFEASFRPQLMEVCEFALYRHMLRGYPKLARVICNTLGGVNHGRMRCGVTFKLKGRRMSGDMCTSLGNGFTNLMVFSWLMQGRSWTGTVEGDDGIFCVHDRKPLPLPADYARLGFDIKIERHERPEKASFCGIVATRTGLIKDPAKTLQSFGWTRTQTHAPEHVLWELLRAKALSLAYEAPHCPILRAVADRALSLTVGRKARFETDGYHQPVSEDQVPPACITPEIRVLFAQQYGVAVCDQLELESRIARELDLSFLSNRIAFHDDTRTMARFVAMM